MSERVFKGELDGMTAALKARLARPDARVPSLDRILSVMRDLIERALVENFFSRNEPAAFNFGDGRTIWVDGWPAGEWRSRSEMFPGETGDDLVCIQVFDPDVMESIQWWVHTADRRKHEAIEEASRRKRSSTAQDERDQVEQPLASHLQFLGHVIKRQVKCSGGRIDILDVTANEIIECKLSGSASSLTAAVLQVRGYGVQFPSASLAIAVPVVEPDAVWLADVLPQTGVRVIEVSKLKGTLQ